MRMLAVARWSDWSGTGSEHLVLRQGPDFILAEAVLLSGAAEPFAAHYRITCDLGWQVQRAEVDLVGAERRLGLTSDGQGRWFDEDRGDVLHGLDGAFDIDLSVSPFTNTLPILRVPLEVGQSVEIRAAYIRFPDLSVTADPQRYTCLEPGKRYRYEALDSDFVREIEVDALGLVVTYPGLFRHTL